MLHVTNGDSAGNLLRRTALGGAVLPWQDVLNEGPLPPLPPAELRQVRSRFLSECGWGDPRPIGGELFAQSRRREEAPFDGDAWFFKRLAELGRGANPLVRLAGGGAVEDPPPPGAARSFARATLELTDAGRAVLAATADRVALLGIDRWVGGTHLRPGHLWRWNRSAGRVVAAPGVSWAAARYPPARRTWLAHPPGRSSCTSAIT